MADLPTGNVTFLFTDIAGSTTLWEHHPEAMPAALARHDAILRHAIEAHSGVIVKTTGDGALAAFVSAVAALGAALAAQRALRAEPWGETGPLRVRIALHTGAVELRDGDYFGPPLNRIARLLAVGHGGQTLLTHAIQELVRARLLPGTTLRDLGEHRLKDLIQPEQIFQLVAPDLPADFPPLKILDNHSTRSTAQEITEQPFQIDDYMWRQAKLPGMPGIDYDTVLEKERERERQRRARKRKPKDISDMF
jgi:class 3 adenylate cyclase